MSAFAILRIKKHKTLASVYHVARHHTRELPCKTADQTRTHLNKHQGPRTARGVVDAIEDTIAKAQAKAPRKFRSDSPKCVEFMIGASPEWWKTATKEQRNGYLNRSAKWLRDKFGAENVACLWVHHDEASPHIHAVVIPMANGVLNAKHYFGGKAKMADLQTEFAKVAEPFGLVRGIPRSRAKHVPVAEFWKALDAPAPKPSRADYAAAALGFKPKTIETQEMQNAALFATRAHNLTLRKNAGKVQATARKNEMDGIRLEAIENFAREGNGAVLEVIEARKKLQAQAEEIEALKAQVARLTPGTPSPGYTPTR